VQTRLKQRRWWGVLTLFLIGAAIRLVGFTRSLWLDEFGTLWAVESTFGQTWHRALSFHGQSPFYYLLTWISVHGLGESEASLRAPSFVFAVGTALTLWMAGRWTKDSRAGWFAAGIFWLCAAAVMESANARPYALPTWATALPILGFIRATTRGDVPGRVT